MLNRTISIEICIGTIVGKWEACQQRHVLHLGVKYMQICWSLEDNETIDTLKDVGSLCTTVYTISTGLHQVHKHIYYIDVFETFLRYTLFHVKEETKIYTN